MGCLRDVQYALAFHSELMSAKQLGHMLLLFSAEPLPNYIPPHVRTTFNPVQPELTSRLPNDTVLREQIPDRIDRAAWKALWLEKVLMSRQRTLEELNSDATAVLSDLAHLVHNEWVNLGVAVVKRAMSEAHILPWDVVTEWFRVLYYHVSPDKLQSLFRATAGILYEHETALCLAISVLSLQSRDDRQQCRNVIWAEYVSRYRSSEAASTLVKVLHSICSADEDRWVLWLSILGEKLDFRRTFSNLGLEKACDKITYCAGAKALQWMRSWV